MRGELQGLGPFRLAGVLGEGERAIVYDAEREGVTTGRGALKVLRPALAADADERSAFERRARAGAGVTHPRLVPTRDYGVIDNTPWVLLERVDGVSLSELFPKRGRPRFSEAAAATVLAAVLEALVAAAAAVPALVHGRLDASNVLVDADGDVRVTGFGTDGDPRTDFLGLARLAQSLTPDWSLAMDSWLDGLQDGDDRFDGPADALEELPCGASDEGREALGRAVKRARKRREQEVEARPDAAASGAGAPSPADGAVASSSPRPPRPATGARARVRAVGPIGREERLDAALRQARVIGYVCGALVLAGVVIEILAFSG